MPGFDGTGPRGMGPRTGWGRRFCPSGGYGYGAPYPYRGAPVMPGAAPYPYPYRGAPAAPGAAPVGPPMSPEQELSFLQDQAGMLKEQLDGMMQRIEELGKQTQ